MVQAEIFLMRNRGTIILVVAVLLSVGYAVYDYQSEKSNEKTKVEQSRLVKFDKDQIDEFEIKKMADPALVVERTQEGWKLKAPIQETGDQSAIQDYLDGVTLEFSHETVKKGAGIDWKIYGLANPAGTLSFKINNGQELKIDVSSSKNFAGDSYVRVQGEDQVYLASSTWLTRLDKKPLEFRDKRILKKSAAVVQSMKLIRSGESFVLEKKNGLWTVPENPTWKLDQTRCDELVYLLNTVKIVEFSKEGAISAADLKNFGLNKPELSVEVELKEKQKWKALFGTTPKKDVFVQTFEPSRVLKITPVDMEKFLKVSVESLRDRHEPFNFNKTLVKKIQVLNGQYRAEFSSKGDDWVLGNEDKNLEYQADRGKAVFALTRSLEVADFGPVAKGGSNLDQEIRFLDDQGKIIYSIKFLRSYKKTIDGMVKAFVLTKTSTFDQEVGIDEGTFRGIGLDSVVKMHENKQEDKVANKVSDKAGNK